MLKSSSRAIQTLLRGSQGLIETTATVNAIAVAKMWLKAS